MSEERHYFREWRKHRHLTLADLAARLEAMDDPNLPTTEASLSRIEQGKQNYKSNMLHALAEIYQCEIWELHGRNPLVAGELVDLVHRLDPAQHPAAAAMIEGLVLAQERAGFSGAPDPQAQLRKRN